MKDCFHERLNTATKSKHLPLLLCGLAATSLITSAALVSPTAALAQNTQNFLVEYSDDKLSIQATDILMKDLLLEIQNQTGIAVNFVANPTGSISLNISEQSIESAIAKITSNHMIIHDTVNGEKKISELIIISDDPELKSTGGVSPNLPSGMPAPAVNEPVNENTNEPATQPTTEPTSDPNNPSTNIQPAAEPTPPSSNN